MNIFIDTASGGGGGPDPDFSSVVLLLPMTGTDGSTTFVDESNSAHSVTAVGNAQVSDDTAPFGDEAALFDGTGDYLLIPTSTDFDFGSGLATVEGWIYITAIPAAAQPIYSNMNNFESVGFHIWIDNNAQLQCYAAGATGGSVSSLDVPRNAWVHWAVTKNGAAYAFWVGGASAGGSTVSSSTIPASTRDLKLGSAEPFFIASSYFDGRLGPIRVTKGVVRYTGAFTPPTAHFPNS
ncbi:MULTISPECIES: LamG domain-containing protein [unclassified Methylibium]|uniref:LamG domain-containing protein n=1 Tax=unclassified Methylibium TaxID=2633235 RepID=UPI0003F40EC6|nr:MULTISPECIES: LamG domain-containing protein [unclassified Methylibium]EWS53342.1 hypothetical protein X551_03872 [Methylibium sp. T29]EWS58655.1 hypothetical protein Y694_03486 [Methylibium sp. T29-B]